MKTSLIVNINSNNNKKLGDMKIFKLLLLVCVLVAIFRQNDADINNQLSDIGSSKQHCIPEHKGCAGGPPPRRLLDAGSPPQRLSNTFEVGSSKQHCIPEHKGCAGGPPPQKLKL